MKNFNEIYGKIYNENYEELNIYHKEQKKHQFLIVIGLFLIYLMVCFYIPQSAFFAFMWYIIFTSLCLNIFRSKKYANCFKKSVINSLIKNYDENFVYEPDSTIPISSYLDAEFEQSIDRYHSEDCISGHMQEVCSFRMGEVKTERKSEDKDGHTHYSTIFQGLFAKIDFPKMIPCTIQIRKNALIKTPSTRYNRLNTHSFSLFNSLKRLEMDSNEFEKLYDLYSDNHIISMQLFTSDIIQMFLDFKNNYKLYPEITIKENSIYIRFKLQGGLFEPKLFKKVLDYKEVQDCYLFINSVMDLCNAILKNIIETEV